MKTLSPKTLVVAGILISFSAFASEDKDTTPFHPFSIEAEAGTTGLGGMLNWRFAHHFGIRGGMDYFSYSKSATIESIPYDANLRLMSELLALNLYPMEDSSFFISAGGLFNQNRLTGSSSEFTLDGYPSSDVGQLNLKVEQQPVNPYFSVGGSLYFDKAKQWSMRAEAGVIFTGNPKVSLTRSGGISNPAIDDAVEQERQMVEDKFENFKFWPVVKLAVSYSF